MVSNMTLIALLRIQKRKFDLSFRCLRIV